MIYRKNEEALFIFQLFLRDVFKHIVVKNIGLKSWGPNICYPDSLLCGAAFPFQTALISLYYSPHLIAEVENLCVLNVLTAGPGVHVQVHPVLSEPEQAGAPADGQKHSASDQETNNHQFMEGKKGGAEGDESLKRIKLESWTESVLVVFLQMKHTKKRLWLRERCRLKRRQLIGYFGLILLHIWNKSAGKIFYFYFYNIHLKFEWTQI